MATLIDTLVTQFDFKADTRGLKTVEKGLKRVNDTAATAGALMGKLNTALGLVGASLGLGKLMDYANNWGKIKVKLSSTGLAGEALADTLKDLKAVSDNTGTALLENAELYQRITQFMGDRISTQDRIKAIDTLSKSAKVYGVSVEDAQRGTAALTKALQSPIVEFRHLHSAMRESHNIGKILEDHFTSLGTTAKVALEQGIDAAELLQIFVAANAKMTHSFSKTNLALVQAKNKLHNSLSQLAGDFRDQTGLTSRLIFFTDWLSGKFNQLSKYIEKNKAAFKALGEVIITIVTILSVRLAFAFGKLVLRFAPLIAGITLVAGAFQDLWVFMRGGESIFGDFLQWLGLSDTAIENLRSGINGLIEGLKWLINTIFESKATIMILVTALGTLGTLWAVTKITKFTRAIGGVTKAVYDLAAATGKQGKVGFMRSFIREIPTAAGHISVLSSRILGFVSAATKLLSLPALLVTPEKTGDGSLFEGNDTRPEIQPGRWRKEHGFKTLDDFKADIAKEKQAGNIANPLQSGIQQANYYSSPEHHALTQHNITKTQNSGKNQHYSDNRKQDFHFTIQNASNPAEVQKTITQALQHSNKQQYKSAVLNFDSTIAR